MTPKFSFHSQTLPTPGVSCSRSAESSVLTIDIAVICMKPDHGNRTAHPFRHKPFSELAPSQISNFRSQIPSEQERRRLWTAGRITALRAHGVRAASSPNTPLSGTSPPKALDCGSLLPLSRSQPAGPAPLKLSTRQVPLRPSPGSRGSALAPPNKQSPHKPFKLLTSNFPPHKPHPCPSVKSVVATPTPPALHPTSPSHFSLLTSPKKSASSTIRVARSIWNVVAVIIAREASPDGSPPAKPLHPS